MKRAITILCIIVLAASCFMLYGCGRDDIDLSDSMYTGTWEATSADFKGAEVTVEEILGGEYVIEFKANGKADITIAGDTSTGDWTETKKGVRVTGSNIDLNLTYKGNQLTTNFLGVGLYLDKIK